MAAKKNRVVTVESETPIRDFDIIAFSISYENDAPFVLEILNAAGLPLPAPGVKKTLPLVLAGGVFCFLNPETLAPFVDVFLLGEAEGMVNDFFRIFDPSADRRRNLLELSRRVPGVYVPAFYRPRYAKDGTLAEFVPTADVPATVRRQMVSDLSGLPTASTVLTSDTAFSDTYLIEVSRGCPHGMSILQCRLYLPSPPLSSTGVARSPGGRRLPALRQHRPCGGRRIGPARHQRAVRAPTSA